ncbi:AdoMet-dependent rRNA methyltransferase spb1 [Tulasnella sp. 403]|nr:AdoMet-dependent rRNA methyltransferase spb1 [Tulasnella sp. 403]
MAPSNSKKSAKGRLDKYYTLAKQQGYRARSAFKLLHLNRKYEFLNTAKFCIDLCAAPGGWLQVASKEMPVGSLILGCDLVPIKPIPRVTTFTCDITTSQCRQLIRSHAKDWHADVVLHDGAPNVGLAWVQDAYSQSELVLSSLKLATEFLRKGGTFVTKVFRSQDYNNLLWVFNQLFGKVEATKPPSSRNVSAEIFVVCQNFLAPAHIDPKFLDPKHVFKAVDSLPPAPVIEDHVSVKTDAKTDITHVKLTPNALNVFKPTRKQRNRDGYADDATTTLFKAGPASQFVLGNTKTAIAFLGDVNRIDFISEEEKRWRSLEVTTDDVKANCEDLKVLGKADFQRLIKWRKAIREELGLEPSAGTEEFTEAAEVVPMDPVDEDEQIEKELERLTGEEAARRKRERKKINERRQKQLIKMQLGMVAPADIVTDGQDVDLDGQGLDTDFFDLNEAEKKKAAKKGANGVMAAYDDVSSSGSEEEDRPKWVEESEYSDSEDEREARVQRMEAEIDGMYQEYMERRMEKDPKYRVRQMRKKVRERTEAWDGVKAKDSDDDSSEEDSDAISADQCGFDNVQATKEQFDESDSDDTDGEAITRTSIVASASRPKKRRKTSPNDEDVSEPEIRPAKKPTKLVTKLDHFDPRPTASKAAQVWFSQDVFKKFGGLDDVSDDDNADDNADDAGDEPEDDAVAQYDADEGDDVEVVLRDEDTTMWDVDDENIDEKKQEKIKKYGLLTPEAVTLAQRLVNRQTTATELINQGFNRYMTDKDNLPTWFVEEEAEHYQPNLPVTKEAVRMLRAKQRALDARPMKKIAEAKARKKMRVLRQLKKAAKMAEGLADNGDMNEKQRSEAMAKVMKKGLKKGKTYTPIKTVVSRGVNKGLSGRPKGVKGRYRLVDKRGKKDRARILNSSDDLQLRAEKRAAKAKKKRRH